MASNRFANLSRTRGARPPVDELNQLETPDNVTALVVERLKTIAPACADILEPAAGTGRIARALAAAFPHACVTRTDIDPPAQVDAFDKAKVHGLDFLADDYATKLAKVRGLGAADSLKKFQVWPGMIVTNPPYSRDRAAAFVQKALSLAVGPVAMLVDAGLLWGDRRHKNLWRLTPPSAIIPVPWRVSFFYRDGAPIDGQFNNHAWLVWNAGLTSDRFEQTTWQWPRIED